MLILDHISNGAEVTYFLYSKGYFECSLYFHKKIIFQEDHSFLELLNFIKTIEGGIVI